jgi:hypothetical protein
VVIESLDSVGLLCCIWLGTLDVIFLLAGELVAELTSHMAAFWNAACSDFKISLAGTATLPELVGRVGLLPAGVAASFLLIDQLMLLLAMFLDAIDWCDRHTDSICLR